MRLVASLALDVYSLPTFCNGLYDQQQRSFSIHCTCAAKYKGCNGYLDCALWGCSTHHSISSKPIFWADDASWSTVKNMRANQPLRGSPGLRCPHVTVAQQFLDRTYIIASLE
jgi:hypothetical protein